MPLISKAFKCELFLSSFVVEEIEHNKNQIGKKQDMQ